MPGGSYRDALEELQRRARAAETGRGPSLARARESIEYPAEATTKTSAGLERDHSSTARAAGPLHPNAPQNQGPNPSPGAESTEFQSGRYTSKYNRYPATRKMFRELQENRDRWGPRKKQSAREQLDMIFQRLDEEKPERDPYEREGESNTEASRRHREQRNRDAREREESGGAEYTTGGRGIASPYTKPRAQHSPRGKRGGSSSNRYGG